MPFPNFISEVWTGLFNGDSSLLGNWIMGVLMYLGSPLAVLLIGLHVLREQKGGTGKAGSWLWSQAVPPAVGITIVLALAPLLIPLLPLAGLIYLIVQRMEKQKKERERAERAAQREQRRREGRPPQARRRARHS